MEENKGSINKIIFGQRLKHLMTNYNETTYSLAAKFNLSPPTISRYTRGEMAPKLTTIRTIADYFDVSPLWLMGQDVSMYEKEPLDPHASFDTLAPVTVFKSIKYDRPVYSNEKSDITLKLPMEQLTAWGPTLALLMPDDSMSPTIEKGDQVIVKLHTFLKSGDLTAVHVNQSDLMIRRVLFNKNQIILQPHNPAYNAELYNLKKDDIQIIGSVIYKRHVTEKYFD